MNLMGYDKPTHAKPCGATKVHWVERDHAGLGSHVWHRLCECALMPLSALCLRASISTFEDMATDKNFQGM